MTSFTILLDAATAELYRRIAARQAKKLQPVIEAKEEEIYAICEKGHSLL